MNEDKVPETVVAEPVPETAAVAHPAGKFMWSMALGGPIISWFFHRKELEKSAKSFFLPMLGWNILTNMVDKALIAGSEMTSPETLNVYDILGMVWFFVSIFILGRLGASKIKECLPEYAPEVYKPRERKGIILGVVIFVIAFFASVFLLEWSSLRELS